MDGMRQFTDLAASAERSTARPAQRRRIDPDVIALSRNALPLWDFASVMGAGLFTAYAYCAIFPARAFDLSLSGNFGREVVMQACICTLLLRAAGARGATSFRMLLAVAGLAIGSLHTLSGAWVLMWSATAFLMVAGGRRARSRLVATLRRKGRLCQRVAVVGCGPRADRLVRYLQSAAPGQTEIIGLYDDRRSRLPPECQLPTGSVADLVLLGATQPPDWIIITLPADADRRIAFLLRDLKSLSTQIAICPAMIENGRQSGRLAGLSLPVLAAPPLRRWNRVAKAIEDLALGSLLLLLLSPVMLAIAIAVRLGSRGPVLFRQTRHGWNNTQFEVLKFRTMYSQDRDDSVLRQTQRGDERITRLGRVLRATSLDELPQLLNVLRGEMSLVGPRPHAVAMRTQDRLGHQIIAEYPHRHRVKPGMTGWAQIHGLRGATSTTDELRHRVEHDLYYIDNWSVLLDLQILARTALHVLADRHAY